MEAGERLKQLRKAKGLNQAQLGEPAGLSAQQVSRLEKGTQTLTVPYLEDLCSTLGISVAEFFGSTPAARQRPKMEPPILANVVAALARARLIDDDSSPEAKADAISMLYTIAEGYHETGMAADQARAELAKDAPKIMRVAVENTR